MLPKNIPEALDILRPHLDASMAQLETLSKETLLQAWNALAFAYPGLHPNDAADHGHFLQSGLRAETGNVPAGGDVRFSFPRYVRSGWPLALAPLADEAWRRFMADEISATEFFPLWAPKPKGDEEQ